MRRCILFTCIAGGFLAAPCWAGVNFSDNFDNSQPGEPGLIGSVWPKWPTAADHMNASTNHNHTPGGTTSLRLDPQDPWTLANYHDLGATSGPIDATVWVWDDHGAGTGTASQPVNFYFGVYGASAKPTDNTDYLLLGLSPTFASNNTYGFRTKYNDANNLGLGDTGVTRTAASAGSPDNSNWFKLGIQADSLGSGGQVRFYLNNTEVGTSYRTPGVDLQYLFLGSQSKNYQFFWFDDVNATPGLIGDVNHDGSVNFSDLLALAQHYGASNAYWEIGDFNGDGSVGFDDLLALAQNYGKSASDAAATSAGPTFASMPEPCGLALLALTGTLLLRRRQDARECEAK